jgi:hypothetical protein
MVSIIFLTARREDHGSHVVHGSHLVLGLYTIPCAMLAVTSMRRDV